jgi:PAS domain S-box-containing protein
MDTFVFKFDENFWKNFIFLPIHEIWMHIFILALLMFVGIYSQSFLKKRQKSEETIWAERKFSRDLINSSFDGIMAYDREYQFTIWNLGMERMFGVKRKDVIGKNAFDLFPFLKDAGEDQIFQDTLSGKYGLAEDRPYIKETGKKGFYEGNYSPMRDPSGNIIGGLAIIRDITEKKIAEERIMEKNIFLNNIIESLTHPFYVINVDDYSIEMANSASSFGTLTKDSKCYELTHKTNNPCNGEHPCPLNLIKKNKKACTVEHIHYDENGIPRNIEIFGYPIFDKEGNVIQMIEYAIDVTERRQAEKKLKESEEKFSKAFHSSPSLMAITRMKDGYFIDVNDTYTQVLGYCREELIGHTSMELNLWVNPEQRSELTRRLKEYKKIDPFDVDVFTKSGKVLTMLFSGDIIYLNNEPHLITMANDITERRKAEKKLKESEEKFRKIFETIPDMYFLVDANGTHLDFKGNKDLLYLTPDMFIGKTIKETMPSNAFEKYNKAIKETLETQNPTIIEYSLPIRGINHYYEARNLYFSKNQVAIFVRDITEKKKAEYELITLKEFYKSILDGIINGVWVSDQNDTIFYSNKGMEKIAGMSSEQINGAKVLLDFPEATLRFFKPFYLEAKQKLIPIYYDSIPIITPVGRQSYQSGWLIPRIKDGQFDGIICTVDDVTERKKAKQKLKLSEKKFRRLTESSPIGIFQTNKKGDCIYVNKRWCEFAGFSSEEALGKGWVNAIHPEDKERVFEEWYKATKLNKEFELDYRFQAPNGKVTWVSGHAISFTNDTDEIIGFLGTISDITDRMKAEQELRESEEKFRTIAEQSFMGISIIQGGLIKYANESLSIINEYSIQEMLSWTPSELFNVIHPDDIEVANEIFMKIFSPDNQIPTYYSYRIITKSGNLKWLNAYSRVMKYQNRDALLTTYMDVTEVKRAEKVIEKEIVKLKQIDQIKNDLIRRISHELKTPLISIYSSANYLLELYKDQFNENVVDIIKIIHNGGERLKSLVDNLLDIYLIETDEFKLEIQRVNLVDVIKQSIDNVKNLISNRKQVLKTDLPKEIFVDIDANRIDQVTTNILANALKYTPPEGDISISLEENGSLVEIEVKDMGIGISKKEQKRLFQKFGKIERFGQGFDVDSEGPGLGLYISNEIVRLHGGKILLNSKGRNKGCTFIVQLPK